VDGPNRLIEAAREIQEFCKDRRWCFCFIGGIAVQRRGEARLTRDADLNLLGLKGDASALERLDALRARLSRVE